MKLFVYVHHECKQLGASDMKGSIKFLANAYIIENKCGPNAMHLWHPKWPISVIIMQINVSPLACKISLSFFPFNLLSRAQHSNVSMSEVVMYTSKSHSVKILSFCSNSYELLKSIPWTIKPSSAAKCV
jgi:hypothetical protein